MLADLFPSACTRLRIFLCHAHSDRAVAEEIAQALKNDGHVVFFDKDSLPPAADYNEQIRKAIRACDCFIFLMSRDALSDGRFTLSELAFVKERWPSAEGHVLPVLLGSEDLIKLAPAYLRSVHVMKPAGNAAAEVAAEMERNRRVGWGCRLVAATLAMLLVAVGVLIVRPDVIRQSVQATLLVPEQIDLRPSMRPATGEAWLDSPVAITAVPMHYSNAADAPFRILQEQLSLNAAGESWSYRWFNEVEITPQRWAEDWLCTKRGLGAQTLDRGGTISRETMFLPIGEAKPLTWRRMLALVFDPSVSEMTIAVKSSGESTGLLARVPARLEATCRIDIAKLRPALEQAGFRAATAPFPPRLAPFCEKAPAG